ncbi:MAG: hypothetical protein JRI31_01780 [Deltaproteobacteria bacterium]|nr:hypothetical protein [Deltaproteobacteria bacterium]
MASLEERIEANLRAFEETEKENERYMKEKEELLAKAKELGVKLDMEIPWDQLNEDQQRELERIRNEGEREIREAVDTKGRSAPKKAMRWTRI